MSGTRHPLFRMVFMDGGLTGILLMCCLCFVCTVPAFLFAGITFPAHGLRMASDTVVVHWQAEYQPRQTVLSESGPNQETPDYTLYLDGQKVVESTAREPRPNVAFLKNLSPGTHTLRLEARAGGRTVEHSVSFEIVEGPSPWSLQEFPHEWNAFYVFDALGRRYPTGEDGESEVRVAHADARGLFVKTAETVHFRPWVWEQLGDVEELPLPEEGPAKLLGPGVVAQRGRLHWWREGAWQALPPFPAEGIPEQVQAYFGQIGPRLFFEDHDGFFWARPCGDALWVSLTWWVRTEKGPPHFAYMARHQVEGDAWEVVTPPTRHGRFLLYCFHRTSGDELWAVNTASDGTPLAPEQWRVWGWFLNRPNPWHWAEKVGLGRTYRWTGHGWEAALAPPLVVRVGSIHMSGWYPATAGPALRLMHEGRDWVMVPVVRP